MNIMRSFGTTRGSSRHRRQGATGVSTRDAGCAPTHRHEDLQDGLARPVRHVLRQHQRLLIRPAADDIEDAADLRTGGTAMRRMWRLSVERPRSLTEPFR
eukprot:354455-Chlamydomonas_euryale.AAC.2